MLLDSDECETNISFSTYAIDNLNNVPTFQGIAESDLNCQNFQFSAQASLIMKTFYSEFDKKKSMCGKNAFPCTYCDKVFPFQSWLVKHIRKHTGEKPFVCDMCGRGFSEKKSMKRHQLTHSVTKLCME